MIHFEHPYYLFLLASLPAFILVYFLFMRWRKRSFRALGDSSLLQKIIPRNELNIHARFVLMMLALTCLIFSLANPQIPSAGKTVKHSGIDVAIVLDCSRSMLATDVHPDRFGIAKQLALNLINALPEEKFALISFAEDPSIVLPLTPDHAAAQMLLQSVNVDVSQGQGSDIGSAIREAIKALPNNLNRYRAIVLLSDGEDFGNEIDQAVQQAANSQIVICTVGIGTQQGTTIPDSGAKAAPLVKRDEQGTIVITKLHPEVLEKLANETDGVAMTFSSGNAALNAVLQRLDEVNKNLYDDQLVMSYDSVFQFFLLPALFFLIAEFFVGSYRFRFLNKK